MSSFYSRAVIIVVFIVVKDSLVRSENKGFRGGKRGYGIDVEANTIGTNLHYKLPEAKAKASNPMDWKVDNDNAVMQLATNLPAAAVVMTTSPKFSVKGSWPGYKTDLKLPKDAKASRKYDIMGGNKRNSLGKAGKVINTGMSRENLKNNPKLSLNAFKDQQNTSNQGASNNVQIVSNLKAPGTLYSSEKVPKKGIQNEVPNIQAPGSVNEKNMLNGQMQQNRRAPGTFNVGTSNANQIVSTVKSPKTYNPMVTDRVGSKDQEKEQGNDPKTTVEETRPLTDSLSDKKYAKGETVESSSKSSKTNDYQIIKSPPKGGFSDISKSGLGQNNFKRSHVVHINKKIKPKKKDNIQEKEDDVFLNKVQKAVQNLKRFDFNDPNTRKALMDIIAHAKKVVLEAKTVLRDVTNVVRSVKNFVSENTDQKLDDDFDAVDIPEDDVNEKGAEKASEEAETSARKADFSAKRAQAASKLAVQIVDDFWKVAKKSRELSKLRDKTIKKLETHVEEHKPKHISYTTHKAKKISKGETSEITENSKELLDKDNKSSDTADLNSNISDDKLDSKVITQQRVGLHSKNSGYKEEFGDIKDGFGLENKEDLAHTEEQSQYNNALLNNGKPQKEEKSNESNELENNDNTKGKEQSPEKNENNGKIQKEEQTNEDSELENNGNIKEKEQSNNELDENDGETQTDNQSKDNEVRNNEKTEREQSAKNNGNDEIEQREEESKESNDLIGFSGNNSSGEKDKIDAESSDNKIKTNADIAKKISSILKLKVEKITKKLRKADQTKTFKPTKKKVSKAKKVLESDDVVARLLKEQLQSEHSHVKVVKESSPDGDDDDNDTDTLGDPAMSGSYDVELEVEPDNLEFAKGLGKMRERKVRIRNASHNGKTKKIPPETFGKILKAIRKVESILGFTIEKQGQEHKRTQTKLKKS